MGEVTECVIQKTPLPWIYPAPWRQGGPEAPLASASSLHLGGSLPSSRFLWLVRGQSQSPRRACLPGKGHGGWGGGPAGERPRERGRLGVCRGKATRGGACQGKAMVGGRLGVCQGKATGGGVGAWGRCGIPGVEVVPFPVQRSVLGSRPLPSVLAGGPRREVGIGLETRFSHTPQPPQLVEVEWREEK